MTREITARSTDANARALRYIGAIRNRAKKIYAQRYWQYLREPLVGAPDRGPLSLMAAQAVEINLREIVEGAD